MDIFTALYPLGQPITTLNKIFSVTYYLDLHNAISSNIDVIFYQVSCKCFIMSKPPISHFLAKYEIYSK
jgi:hypothetical protein